MSGHSKWATTHRLKEVTDKKRGKLFSRIVYTIRTAVREGGGDRTTNARLRSAMEKAKQANMPKENIERAIANASGGGGDTLKEARYEVIGPEGSGIVIDTITDNRNRTLSEIKTVLTNYQASIAEPGAVLWQFDPKGILCIESLETITQLEEDSIFAGADDISLRGTAAFILTKPTTLEEVRIFLENRGWAVTESKIGVVAKNFIELPIEGQKKVSRLLQELEEIDDVQAVYTNVNLQ